MPSAPLPKELLPSFLDRLIDAGREDTVGPYGYTLDQMVDAIRADIEELLNTRQSRSLLDCPYPEVKNSVLGYGLPDLNSIPGASVRESSVVGQQIAAIVERFEPRLRRVRVHVVADETAPEEVTRLRYQIEGVLNVDPAPEVGFETVVELSTGQTIVKTSSGQA